MKTLFGSALLSLAGSAAHASSPGAWAAFDREVAQRCTIASKLDHARAARPIGFDDSLGKVVTLVTGQETIRARRGVGSIPAQKLCVYDQRSKRVWIGEAKGWTAPAAR